MPISLLTKRIGLDMMKQMVAQSFCMIPVIELMLKI